MKTHKNAKFSAPSVSKMNINERILFVVIGVSPAACRLLRVTRWVSSIGYCLLAIFCCASQAECSLPRATRYPAPASRHPPVDPLIGTTAMGRTYPRNPPQGDIPYRLNDNRRIHLRHTTATFGEDDRHLENPAADCRGAPSHINLEDIAVRFNGPQIHMPEQIGPVRAKPGGHIAHTQPQHPARIP